MDGAKWLRQRKATSKVFSGNQWVKFTVSILYPQLTDPVIPVISFRGIISESIEADLAKLRIILSQHAKTEEGGVLFFLCGLCGV